jgi:hypothetical protein
MRIPTSHWYTYICLENEERYFQGLNETLQFRYHLGMEIHSLRSVKDALRMGRDFSSFLRGRFLHKRPLVKDPFAVFSVDWYARRLDCQVVCVVRHPAAFVSSLMRLEWPFELSDLTNQSLLMRDWLIPFQGEIEKIQSDSRDVVAQGSLLWKMIYQVIYRVKQQDSNIIVVRHEDLSADPINRFKQLYSAVNLNYSTRVEKFIIEHSRAGNPGESSKGAAYSVRLDSRANLNNWKRRLSSEDITRIRKICEPVARLYYVEQDWE